MHGEVAYVVIVVPAHNAAKTLEDRFRRIPDGYYDEVIVVDDVSLRSVQGGTPSNAAASPTAR